MAAEEQAVLTPEGEPVLEELPVLTVRDTVIFPGSLQPITVGRPSSMALAQSLGENRTMVVIAQLDPRLDTPKPDDLYQTGTICTMHKAIRIPKDNLLLFCEGIARVRTREFTATDPFLRARVERMPDVEPEITSEVEALRQNVIGLFQQIVAASPNLSDDLSESAFHITEPGKLADFAAGNLPSLSHAERQELLEQADGQARLTMIHRHLARELELLDLRNRIQSQVQGQLSQSQREFYLREQLKAIQKELGEGDDSQRDLDDLRSKLEAAGMTEEVKEEALRELGRLGRMSPASPEHSVTRTYLEWMASLPWNVSSASRVDVKRASEILDEDHYDLEKVKDRVLDYLAVLQLRPVLKGPILCFVGPPGVGKTSLGKSIARALGRKFARVSMGGMHDEAEIRGHRRTYIGALPGQIIQGLKRVGTNDPVFMLDEVDKLGRDFRGNPASALLEVLDPEQNVAFRDNYLDVPFNLSKVLFITTANVLDPVPDALRDRMEIIPLEGYTEQEKLIIARVAPHDETHRGVLELNIGFRVQTVFRGLPRNQVAARDDHLLLLGVALQRDDLHAVAQRVGHRVEHVGGGDEEHLREVERHVQVVVAEGEILLGIEHFEQRRRRVAAEVAPQLVHFVEHEYRVVGSHPPQALDDLPRQRADIGPAVAADFGFVVHAAHRNARELAAQRARDGLAERGFPHARRSHEAQDGALQHRPELQHRQVVENPVLHFFQVVVVLVQDLGRPFHVHPRGGGHVPRQARHPFQVGPRDAVFRRCRRHAPQPAQLAQGFLLHLFGHARRLRAWRAGRRARAASRRLRPVPSGWPSTARAGRTPAGSGKAAPAPGTESGCAGRAVPARA